MNVLIVDDVKMVRDIFDGMFDNHPDIVSVCASSYRDAVEKLKQFHFDFAVIDIVLESEPDGNDLAKFIMDNYHDTRVFMMTGFNDATAIHGVEAVLQKPVSVDELVDLIKGE